MADSDFPDAGNEEAQPEVIVPRYKMIVSYDVNPSTQDGYYQFIMTEFVPALQEMGLYMTEAWHTAYGNYPIRMVSFVSEDYETIENTLSSTRWVELEQRLQTFVENYSTRVVQYRQGFQFTN
jgi:hypothetical protein